MKLAVSYLVLIYNRYGYYSSHSSENFIPRYLSNIVINWFAGAVHKILIVLSTIYPNLVGINSSINPNIHPDKTENEIKPF